MSNAALAFLTGLGQGYLQGKDNEDKKKRQDLRDQRDQEEHDSRMAERRVKSDGDKALRLAATPATVVSGANGMVRPDTMDDRDVGLPENDSLPNRGLLPAAYRVGMQTFKDESSASAAAATQNQPSGLRARQVAALQGIDPERALKLEAAALTVDSAQQAQARKLKEEGVFDTARAARGGDAQGVFDSFNKNGKLKLQGVPTVTPEMRDIPGVGKVQTYTYSGALVAPDGSVQPFQKNSHDLSMEVMPFEKSLELQQKGKKEDREGRKTDAEVGELDAKAGYYKSAAGEKDAKADGATGKPVKMDEADKFALQSINKQRETINTAITKAQAEGMWSETGANAAALRKQLADLGVREQLIVRKYADASPGVDPAALRKSPAATSTRVLPAEQAARDTDRVSILQGELAKAKQRVAAGDTRAQVDVEAVTRELQRAGVKSPRPAAAAGFTIAAPAAATPTAAAGAQANPMEAAGQRLDAARVQLRNLQASAPGLAKGRAAIDQHAQAVTAVRAEVAAAEAEYQRLVAPQVKPAFIAAHRGM